MLTTLKRIIQEVNQIPVLDDALSCLASRLIDALQVDSCSIYLADYNKQHFLLMATDGLAKSAVGQVSVGFSEGLVGLIGQREEPLNISDAPAHPSFKHYPEVNEDNYHAFLGAPIIHKRKVLGVLTLQQTQNRRFRAEEEAFLVTLAMQLAYEIVNAEGRGLLNFAEDPSIHQRQKSLHGVPGSSGLASGTGFVINMSLNLQSLIPKRSNQTAKQIQRYRDGVKKTRKDLAVLSERIQGEVPKDVQSIFQLYHHLLDANSLGREVEEKINAGWDAPTALKMVVEHYILKFQNMSDSYMRERAADVEDMGNRVLANILGKAVNKLQPRQPPENSILVAEEVTAAMLAEFPKGKLIGIISMRGSHNSHGAIMARGMGLPAVMGVSDVPLALLNEKEILLDGYTGDIIVSPNAIIRREFIQLIQEEDLLTERIKSQDDLPAVTLDNCSISLLVNAGLSIEAENNENPYSDGVGLYRTEVPFMMRQTFPTEHDQVLLYSGLLAAEPNKPFTMRTLDVGGDKPLPYFPISEENPFLGWRGIRMTLDHPEIFLVQIRAMLRASVGLNNLQIMLPMITSVSEVNEAKRLIRQAFYEVAEEALEQDEILTKPKIGVMLEVPAVIYQLPQLAKIVDFFSVGTNDLTQYLLAVDRNNARVAGLYDAYHPAVLAALYTIIKQADNLKVPITVCGELAGEPGGVVLLVAMGYRKLSMNNRNLLKVKWIVRSVHLQKAQQLLVEVLTLDDPQDVRHKVNLYLESIGLGGLVRAGN
ncbi:MAG: phosphotransferase system enzyme I (PtsP) [Paraglaciecola sp.]|jgi:phosphotransferase system enzyme I (PtsP)